MNIIAAMDSERGIGLNNKLPWDKLNSDMQWFKYWTTDSTIIMGRNTYESIGLLPNRRSIVVTSKEIEGVETVKSLDEALEIDSKAWVIGGAKIYAEALTKADSLFLTIVANRYKVDTIMPEFEKEYKLRWATYESPSQFNKVGLHFMILDRGKLLTTLPK